VIFLGLGGGASDYFSVPMFSLLNTGHVDFFCGNPGKKISQRGIPGPKTENGLVALGISPGYPKPPQMCGFFLDFLSGRGWWIFAQRKTSQIWGLFHGILGAPPPPPGR